MGVVFTGSFFPSTNFVLSSDPSIVISLIPAVSAAIVLLMASVAVRHFRQDDLPIVKSLFTAYQVSLGVDISFQNYEEEFESLPGKYVKDKGGALLVAVTPTATTAATLDGDKQETGDKRHAPDMEKGLIVGCVALRRIDSTTTEMKRLYVRPEARGLQAGSALCKMIIEEAKQLRYHRILLDTLSTLTPAIKLYTSLGFHSIDAYYHNPLEGVIYMEKTLQE